MARAFVRASSQYISCGNASALNPQNNMTLACWVYPTTLATGQTFQSYIMRDASSARCYNLGLQAFATPINRFYASVSKNNTTGSEAFSTTVAVINTWYHVCSTYEFVTDGTSVFRIYVNGTQESSIANAVGPINEATADAEIGRRTLSPVFHADARIADVGIWNQTLTAAEVGSLADGMSCDKVRPQGLVLYAPLVRDLIDLKGNTLTNNGTTVVGHPRIYA